MAQTNKFFSSNFSFSNIFFSLTALPVGIFIFGKGAPIAPQITKTKTTIRRHTISPSPTTTTTLKLHTGQWTFTFQLALIKSVCFCNRIRLLFLSNLFGFPAVTVVVYGDGEFDINKTYYTCRFLSLPSHQGIPATACVNHPKLFGGLKSGNGTEIWCCK